MKQKGPFKMEVRVRWRLFDWLLFGAGKSVMNDPPKDDLDDAIVCLAFKELLTDEHLRSSGARKLEFKRGARRLKGTKGKKGSRNVELGSGHACHCLSYFLSA